MIYIMTGPTRASNAPLANAVIVGPNNGFTPTYPLTKVQITGATPVIQSVNGTPVQAATTVQPPQTRLQRFRTGIVNPAVSAVARSRIGTGAGKISTGVGQTLLGVGEVAVATATIPIRAVGYASQKVLPPIDTAALDRMKQSASTLDNVPAFYKIAFLLFFYIFFYKIIFDFGMFFGLKNLELILYMSWFGILLLFLSFIGSKRSKLK